MIPGTVEFVHHIRCRHQVEVEVMPARATLYWQDERFTDPMNTQVRFGAEVLNSAGGVTWQVLAPDGGAGHGSIDATGLYRAPPKGTLASGTTEIVVATARADPLRKAAALVTLVGLGPAPAPAPEIEIRPRRAVLYYRTGLDNAYIDDSNKQQLFQAFPRHPDVAAVRWTVNGAVQAGNAPWFLYTAPNGGGTALVTVQAALLADLAISDEARVTLLNYDWPGI